MEEHEHKWLRKDSYKENTTTKGITYWAGDVGYMVCRVKGCNLAKKSVRFSFNHGSISAQDVYDTVNELHEFTHIDYTVEPGCYNDYDVTLYINGFNYMTEEEVTAAKQSVKDFNAHCKAREAESLAKGKEAKELQIEWAKNILKEAGEL